MYFISSINWIQFLLVCDKHIIIILKTSFLKVLVGICEFSGNLKGLAELAILTVLKRKLTEIRTT